MEKEWEIVMQKVMDQWIKMAFKQPLFVTKHQIL